MKRILLFTSIWFIISLVQSYFFEIVDDEAYYWVYSRSLDWGYFDHPPMIALLIRIGYALFPGELGVRLLPSLLGAGTFFMLLFMLKDEVKDLRLLILASLSIPLFHSHVAGFLAIPDLPMVFFATLFFYFYKRYLEKESALNILLLALSIAMMLYSKYHGFLVIAFTLLSNLKLFARRSFWLLAAISLVLYLPHIIWQIQHDFVSFSFHLVDRNEPFQFRFVIEYLVNQIIMVGPFAGVILIYFGFARKTESKFELGLKLNLIGFFLGFLFLSLKGRVEPHWTAFAIVPLILLAFPEIDKRVTLRKWVSVLSFMTIPLILFIRLAVTVDVGVLPEKLDRRFLNKKEYYLQIREEAGSVPVVFNNSYQHPSLYWFFTKEASFTKNDRLYRKNQYDLMDLEAELHGKEVLYFTRFDFPGCDSVETVRGNILVHRTPCFASYNRVEVNLPEIDWDFETSETVKLDLELGNPTDRRIFFSDSCTFPPVLVYTYYSEGDRGRAHFAHYNRKLPSLAPGEFRTFPVEIKMPFVPGTYRLSFGFGAQNMPAGINGRPVRLKVRSSSN